MSDAIPRAEAWTLYRASDGILDGEDPDQKHTKEEAIALLEAEFGVEVNSEDIPSELRFIDFVRLLNETLAENPDAERGEGGVDNNTAQNNGSDSSEGSVSVDEFLADLSEAAGREITVEELESLGIDVSDGLSQVEIDIAYAAFVPIDTGYDSDSDTDSEIV